jgi:hypothetical protein
VRPIPIKLTDREVDLTLSNYGGFIPASQLKDLVLHDEHPSQKDTSISTPISPGESNSDQTSIESWDEPDTYERPWKIHLRYREIVRSEEEVHPKRPLWN